MKSIGKNFFYNVMYQVLAMILPLITAPYISRVIGVEGLGVYSYTYSIANYFLLFAMLGISNHGNRSIAAVRKNKNKMSITFSDIYLIQFINSLLALIGYFIYLRFFCKADIEIALIQSLLVSSAVFDISWLFFGLEEFKLTVTRNTIFKLASVVLIFLFVKNEADLWKYSIIMVLSVLVSQLILWSFIKNYLTLAKPSFKRAKSHLKPILILFLPALSYSLYRMMGKIMIGKLSTMAEVGFFDNADKVIIMPMGIITALGTVMLPRISNMVANGESKKQKIYFEKSIQAVTIISSALSFGLAAIADVFAPIFFGEEFVKSGVLITCLSITILFASWANVVRTQFIIPNKKDNIYVFSMLFAAVISLILNLIFIPKYQSYGAVIGSIAAEFLVMALQFYGVRKDLEIGKYIKNNLVYIFFGIIMFIVVKLIGNILDTSIFTLVIQIVSGSLIYCILTFIYLIYINKSTVKK